MRTENLVWKKNLAVLLAALLLAVVGCQPTPKVEPIPNKGDAKAEQVINSATAPETTKAPFVIPDHWTDVIETKDWTVPIDAEIITSGQTSYPIRTAKRREFTPEDVVRVASSFFQKMIGFREGNKRTADEYNKAMASTAERGLDEQTSWIFARSKGAGDLPYTHVDHLTATDIPSMESVVMTILTENGNGSIYGEKKHIAVATALEYTIIDKTTVESDGSFDGEGPVSCNPKISKEQAESIAQSFLEEAGFGDFCNMVKAKESRYFDFLSYEEISVGWQLQMMRSYEYLPLNLSDLDSSQRGPIRFSGEDYSPAWAEEYFNVYVSEAGVVEQVEWHYPCLEGEVVNEDVELMPVEELETVIKRMVSYGLPSLASTGAARFGYRLAVTHLILTTTLQPVKDDPNTAYRMPTWICRVALFNLPYNDPEDPNAALYYGFNAIDGTHIVISH